MAKFTREVTVEVSFDELWQEAKGQTAEDDLLDEVVASAGEDRLLARIDDEEIAKYLRGRGYKVEEQ